MKLYGVFSLVCLIFLSPTAVIAPPRPALPARYLISGVPYIKQKREHCGPASLAMVFGRYNVILTQDELAEEFYRKKLSGSLNLDMLISARRHGFSAFTPEGSMDLLRKYISSDVPIIVMVRSSADSKKYHFMVIYGYDDTKELFRIHSGRTRNGTISYQELDQIWAPTGKWMLVVERKNWGEWTVSSGE